MPEPDKRQDEPPKPAEHDTEPKNPNEPKMPKRQDDGQQAG